MLKKIVASIIVIIAITAIAVFIYRYQILQYSAETIIRKILPDYVRVDTIIFRPQEEKLTLKGFKILNPPGFSSRYLIEIDEVIGTYKMKGKSIIDGIEMLEPVFKKATLNIERLSDGTLNLVKMQTLLEKGAPKAPKEVSPATSSLGKKAAAYSMIGNRKISEIVKLPETFALENSKIIFTDRFVGATAHIITFEDINSTVSLKLNDMYSKVLNLASIGSGRLNGDSAETIKWNIVWDPTTPMLTMSNRFDVSNLDLLTLEPYYDKYSPLVFKSGRFSGTLIFDFNNGDIGSSDEIHLSGAKFNVKQGYENAPFWDTTVPDLVKYFTSPHGEIVFDFKIKGTMSKPQFYLGPISKQALTSMAIDKISSAIDTMSQGQGGTPGAPKNDIQKAKEYIDLFKGMINKK